MAVTNGFALVAIGHALGCGQIVGIDEFAVGDPAPELPLLPAQPDSWRVQACEACAEAECGNERQACLASAACRDLLDCHGRCSDPACIFRCRDTHATSFAFDDYFTCVIGVASFNPGAPQGSRCRDECGTGDNWECVRSYQDDASTAAVTLDFTFHDSCRRSYGPLSTFAGMTVAPCSSIGSPGTPDGAPGTPAGDEMCDPWQSVDGHGQAQMTLRQDYRSGVLALRGDGQATRIYYRDAPRSGRVDVQMLARYCYDFVLPNALLGAYDRERAIVAFLVPDCLGTGAIRTRVELSSEGKRFYWIRFGEADTTVETGGGGGFANVPASHALEISAWLENVPEPVSRKKIVAADGWVTNVQMFPMSKDDPL